MSTHTVNHPDRAISPQPLTAGTHKVLSATLRLGLSLLVVLALAGCGDSESKKSGTPAAAPMGTGLWAHGCNATFTKAYEVREFGNLWFTAQIGDEFLMSEYRAFVGNLRVEMLHMSNAGAVDFEVEPEEDGSLPFIADCDEGEGLRRIGVFKDTTFYVDEALTQEACTLEAGTNAAIVGVTGYGLIDGDDPATYSIAMGGLAAACGGHNTTYVSVKSTRLFGVNETVVPVNLYIAPANYP